MKGEIINRVANSKLKTIDLEDFYPQGDRILFDLSDFLFEGLILREKEFRQALDSHNWTQYKNAFVAIDCSTEAIIPSWARMIIATKLSPHAKKVVSGNLQFLEAILYHEIILKLDTTPYKDVPVIIKGCANKPIPESAFSFLIVKLQSVCKSIMYGEACSTVPMFKK